MRLINFVGRSGRSVDCERRVLAGGVGGEASLPLFLEGKATADVAVHHNVLGRGPLAAWKDIARNIRKKCRAPCVRLCLEGDMRAGRSGIAIRSLMAPVFVLCLSFALHFFSDSTRRRSG